MFDKAQNNTLVMDIVRQISNNIIDGIIKKGEMLPSEKKLCDQFGVSRTTIRNSLQILAKHRFIETVRGKGSTVIADNFEDLSNELRGKIHEYMDNFKYAVEVRSLLEPQVAYLATLKATPQDIKELKEIQERCEKRMDDGGLMSSDLRAFHLRLAKIPNNPLLYSMVEMLISMCDAPVETYLQTPNFPDPRRHKITHQDIIEAIQNRDPESAYFYMKENIKTFIIIA
jgi:DNA-binding FadR family transcriptional regulator